MSRPGRERQDRSFIRGTRQFLEELPGESQTGIGRRQQNAVGSQRSRRSADSLQGEPIRFHCRISEVLPGIPGLALQPSEVESTVQVHKGQGRVEGWRGGGAACCWKALSTVNTGEFDLLGW